MVTKNDQAAGASQHDVVVTLREYAGNPGYSHNDYADTMRQAAHCIESLRAMFYHYGASTGAAPEAPATEQQADPSLIELESTVAAARADAALFNDEAMRLRRVVRALGMESEVPEDNATLRGCLFAVLGQIACKLERATPAATTASTDKGEKA